LVGLVEAARPVTVRPAFEENQMDEQPRVGLEDRAPMVLRRMPVERRHLGRSMTGSLTGAAADVAGGTWWEYVDAAAAAELPPAAVALTLAAPDGVVTLCAIGARRADAAHDYAELLRALVAALRSRSAETVIMRDPGPAAVSGLLAAGFTPTADPGQGELYLISL
jgi:hypothetical protein